MKKSLSLLALAAAASFAGPVKVGVEATGGYNFLSIGDSVAGNNETSESKPSFGLSIGPTAAYSINEKFAIGGKISFQYDINNSELAYSGGKEEYSSKMMSLGFQIAPSYQINEKLSAKIGYEFITPLSGTDEVSSGDWSKNYDIARAPDDAKDILEVDEFGDYTGDLSKFPVVSTHNLILGASYLVIPNLTVSVQGKFAFTGPSAHYKSLKLDGAQNSDNNTLQHQLSIGVNYNFL